VRAERGLQRRLANAEADLGLEPLPVDIDQVDDGYRRLAQPRGEFDDIVKVELLRAVETS